MHDPYAKCETLCTHDVGRGVLLSEVLGDEDGPYPDRWNGWGNRAPIGVPLNVRGWMDIIRRNTMEG